MMAGTLASRLRDAVADSPFEADDLAERVAVRPRELHGWLNGTAVPESAQVHALAESLDIDAGWLEDGSGTAPNPNLEAERSQYEEDSGWGFREVPPDGGRDYGNANIWAFAPDLDTFVREVGQNTLDVIRGTSGSVTFRLVRLRDDRLETFKQALQWDVLHPHLSKSAEEGQKFGLVLAEALAQLEGEQELLLLRIEEQGTTGLTGSEHGSGSNFAALTRNNLDSNKQGSGAGGAFGLGKAVLWRTSMLSTVLFNSDLAVPEHGKQEGRLIGRTELSFHKVSGETFAGPGWFGQVSGGPTESYWGNRALARDLLLDRTPGTAGTSILVIGFHDPQAEETPDPDELSERLGRAAGTHFWPALESGRLQVTTEVAEGGVPDDVLTSAKIAPEKVEPEFTELIAKYRANDLHETLEAPGQVAVRHVELEIPAHRHGDHPSLTHEAVVIVRRAREDDEEATPPNRVHFYRGTEMVVVARDMSNIRVGARPFHAAVLCGTAAGDSAINGQAEEFLRLAEPPAHNRWELTPDLASAYARGSGAALQRFFERVRGAIGELVGPASQDLSDGPRGLKELLKVAGERDHEPRPAITTVQGEVDADGRWDLTVDLAVKAQPGAEWLMRPTCLFQTESGPNKKVEWLSLTAVSNCEIVPENRLKIPLGRRTARFRGISDPASHPLPAGEAAVSVDLRQVEKSSAGES